MILGIYLSLYRYLHDSDPSVPRQVPFPGSAAGYKSVATDSPMSSCAKFQIFAGLNGQKTAGQSYNMADEPATFETKWPAIAEIFGLEGVPPTSDKPIDIEAWVNSHKEKWTELEDKYGLKKGVVESTGWDFARVLSIPFDRPFDLTKVKETGFKDHVGVIAAFKETFDYMTREDVKVLPPLSL